MPAVRPKIFAGAVLGILVCVILIVRGRPSAERTESGLLSANQMPTQKPRSSRKDSIESHQRTTLENEATRTPLPPTAWSIRNKPPLSIYPGQIRKIAASMSLRGKTPARLDIPNLHPSVVDSTGLTNETRLAAFLELYRQKSESQSNQDRLMRAETDRQKNDTESSTTEKLSRYRRIEDDNDPSRFDNELEKMDTLFAKEDGNTPPNYFPPSRASQELADLLGLPSEEAIPFGSTMSFGVAAAQAAFQAEQDPQRAIDSLQRELGRALGRSLTPEQIEKLLIIPHDKLFLAISKEEAAPFRDEINRRIRGKRPGER